MRDLLEHVDAVGTATLTLNRPEKHNAFDDVLIQQLTDALARLGARADIRAVILTGAGRSFSAGGDLGWMQRMAAYSDEENVADAAELARLMHTLDRLPKPTIARVNGAAYGGAVGLVACCDIAIAADRATFMLSEVKVGITPATISPYVVAAIGPRHARRYFMTAEPITAARAAEMGLVHEVVAEADLDAACAAVVSALMQGAPGAQADAKDLVFLAEGRAIDAALSAETSRRIAVRRASAEGQEGLGAFLAKRAPSWRPA